MHHALFLFAIGFAALAFLRHRHRRRWAHAGCGGPPWRRHHGWHRHGSHRHGSRAWRNALFERLDLTPSQEKELRAIITGLREAFDPLRDEADRSRADLAAALRADPFEDAALDDMYARHEERLAVLRVDLTTAIGRVHELLDERQRERLADLLESKRGPWHGPYR